MKTTEQILGWIEFATNAQYNIKTIYPATDTSAQDAVIEILAQLKQFIESDE